MREKERRAITIACDRNDKKEVEKLLKIPGISIPPEAFLATTYDYKLDLLQYLLKKETFSKGLKNKALRQAVRGKQWKTVSLLVEKGANLSTCPKKELLAFLNSDKPLVLRLTKGTITAEIIRCEEPCIQTTYNVDGEEEREPLGSCITEDENEKVSLYAWDGTNEDYYCKLTDPS